MINYYSTSYLTNDQSDHHNHHRDHSLPRLILLIAIVIALVLLVRRVQAMPPHKRRSGYLQLILGVAVVATVILTLTGKMHWVGAAVTGLLVGARQLFPLLVRTFPLFQHLLGQRQSAGQQSEVKTSILRMTLDHSNGELNGEVLAGPFKDWLLSEMNLEQLQALLAYCASEDADSEQLLASYLEQRFPDGWDGTANQGRAPGENSSGMTRNEALAVLGLTDDASDEDIVTAHRSLIQKLHPDRGGNDYLAAKINEAKDFLLKA